MPYLKIDRICGTLIQKLQPGDQGWSLPFVISAIRSAEVELETAENKTRQLRFTSWKIVFALMSNLLVNGLKSVMPVWKSTSTPLKVHVPLARSQFTRFAIFGAISGPLLRKQVPLSLKSEDSSLLMQCVTTHGGVTWKGFFSRIAVDMKGSAGGDGWTGLDLSRFPPAFWDLYLCALIIKGWLVKGDLPHMILQARTVFLLKSDKVVYQGVAPKDVRPITILSVWWRLFCSAWLKRDITSNWLKHILHKDVVYGKGSDGQVAAATVLQHFQQHGYMCSLDYTKCFDLLRPVASKQLLDASACCLNMSDGLRGTVFLGSNPLDTKGLSIPQGDPLGPMLAALWLSSGQRFVEEP